MKLQNGFSALEVIIAAALFVIFASSTVGLVIQSYNANRQGAEFTVANQYTTEGIEALRSISNRGYGNLENRNSAGVQPNISTGVWELLGESSNNTFDKYTRTLKIEFVNRDVDGNIVIPPSGTTDANTKRVISTVTWDFVSGKQNSVILSSYLTNWRAPLAAPRGGFLVYRDINGSQNDRMSYRILDTNGNWSTAVLVDDFDTSNTNRSVRSIRVFASSTRNEKIVLFRAYNGTTQYIYAFVFNGTSWINPAQLLSSWNATTFLDVRNFDGAYLNNGNFMAVYSDNTNIPKYRIWNGTSWTAQTNTTNVGAIPTYIVTRTRPSTNEVMLAVFDQTSDTNTSYFNGTSWSSAIQHTGAAPSNTKEHIDFAWSAQNTTKGAFVYSDNNSDKSQAIKIWTANGTGGGSWSAAVQAPNTATNIGPVAITSRKGAEEFLSCNKIITSNSIICTRGNTIPSWTSPINNNLGASDPGSQRSFDLVYEAATGSQGIIVYSDNTSIPKLKKYIASTNTVDSSPISLTALGAGVKTVRLRSDQDSDDIIILTADANNDLFSVVWNGNTDSVYTSGGKAHTAHGTNGSSNTDFWYDFAWDRF